MLFDIYKFASIHVIAFIFLSVSFIVSLLYNNLNEPKPQTCTMNLYFSQEGRPNLLPELMAQSVQLQF